MNPEEFGLFIGEDMRLDSITMPQDASLNKMLEYYMGKNTPVRQNYIMENLRAEVVDELQDLIMEEKTLGLSNANHLEKLYNTWFLD